MFGPVIDQYTMTDSVKDGITVRLVYDGRPARATLDDEKVKEIEDYYAQCLAAGSNEYQVEASKKAVTNMAAIFPQTPTDAYWTERFGRFSDAEKKMLAGSIGNLVPLQKSINSKLQNRDFLKKKEEYRKGCNSETDVAICPEWGPRQIYDRGMKLLKFMDERWELGLTDEQKKQLLHIEFIHDR